VAKQPAALVLTPQRLLRRNAIALFRARHRPLASRSKPGAHSPKETSPKRRAGTLKWKVGPTMQPLWGQRQAEEALARVKRSAKRSAFPHRSDGQKLVSEPWRVSNQPITFVLSMVSMQTAKAKQSAAGRCWCVLGHHVGQWAKGMPPTLLPTRWRTLNKCWLHASVSPSVTWWCWGLHTKADPLYSLSQLQIPCFGISCRNWCFRGVHEHLSQRILIHVIVMHAGFCGLKPGEPQTSTEKSSQSFTQGTGESWRKVSACHQCTSWHIQEQYIL